MRRLLGVALVAGTIVVPSMSARAEDAASVGIYDNYFSPDEIHVAVGGTVTWTDLGGNHTVTSDDGVSFDSSPSCNALLGSGCMASGDTFDHQFQVPGETVTYHCRVHGSAMTGKVVVDAAPTTTSTTSTTIATTTSISETSTSLASDQTTITQASLPSLPATSRVALPKSIRSKNEDDMRPWVFAAVGLAGATTIAGIILVRRGRVPLG